MEYIVIALVSIDGDSQLHIIRLNVLETILYSDPTFFT